MGGGGGGGSQILTNAVAEWSAGSQYVAFCHVHNIKIMSGCDSCHFCMWHIVNQPLCIPSTVHLSGSLNQLNKAEVKIYIGKYYSFSIKWNYFSQSYHIMRAYKILLHICGGIFKGCNIHNFHG